MSGKHAKFSPSAADRWLTCPGSVALSANIPDESSPYADEGTKAHELFEALLLGKTFVTDMYPEDMFKHVARSVEEALNLVPEGTKFYTEQKLRLNGQVYGTADLVIPEYFGTLTIADFKYGQGLPVGALEGDGTANKQLLLYATMASAHWGDDFSQVRLVILQPRVDAGLVTDVLIPMADVIALRAEVEKAVIAASQVDAPLVPSAKACRWCKAKPICPKLTQDAEAVTTASLAQPSALTLSPERISEILSKRDQIEGWFKAVYAYGIKLAEAGVDVPGYVLKPKRAYTRWKPGAEKAAMEAYGQKLFEHTLLTPAQAKKKIGDNEFYEEWTDSTSSGTNLVQEKVNTSDLMF